LSSSGVDFGEVVLCGSLGAVGHPKPEAFQCYTVWNERENQFKNWYKKQDCM